MNCRKNPRDSCSWSFPLSLVEATSDGRKLEVNDTTIQLLRSITKLVIPVAIAGIYRTGKSYLMNRLAGKSTGFPLGSTIESKTKGIWIWCVDHPLRSDCVLLLLDTEGFGDTNKGDRNHDVWIFVLSILLSSCLIYNSLGTINQRAIEDVHFVTETAKHIRIRTKDANDADDFDLYFPIFIWTVRDFTLELELKGRKISPNEYLEHALHLQTDGEGTAERYNAPKLCLQQYFRKRYCYTFPPPVGNRKLFQKLESLAFSDLDPEFEQITEQFLSFIYSNVPVKTIEGNQITGNVYASITECYVAAINGGQVPCIQSALETTAEIENRRAIDEGVSLYRRLMSEIQLPTDNEEELFYANKRCAKEASTLFLNMVIFDKSHKYDKKFKKEIDDAYEECCKRNENASSEKCREILQEQGELIKSCFERGCFFISGGYLHYQTKIQRLKDAYLKNQGKGVMADQELHKYLNEQDSIASVILASDIAMTEREKNREALERHHREAKRKVADETKAREMAQNRLRDQQKNNSKFLKMLERQMKKQAEQIRRDQRETLEYRQRQQKKMLQDGYTKECDRLRQRIARLKQR